MAVGIVVTMGKRHGGVSGKITSSVLGRERRSPITHSRPPKCTRPPTPLNFANIHSEPPTIINLRTPLELLHSPLTTICAIETRA